MIAVSEGDPERAIRADPQGDRSHCRILPRRTATSKQRLAGGGCRAERVRQLSLTSHPLDPNCQRRAHAGLARLLCERASSPPRWLAVARRWRLPSKLAEAHDTLGNALRGLGQFRGRKRRRCSAAPGSSSRARRGAPTSAIFSPIADATTTPNAGHRQAVTRWEPGFALAHRHGLATRLHGRGEIAAAGGQLSHRHPATTRAGRRCGTISASPLRALGRIEEAVDASPPGAGGRSGPLPRPIAISPTA